MPNWCSNDLFIYGEARGTAALAISNEFDGIDFEKIIPMPPDVEASKGVPGPYPAWYEWSIQNWGTKWNAARAERVAETPPRKRVKITFETAWGPPLPVIMALSKQHPTCTFSLRYYERGMQFKGRLKVRAGAVLEDSTAEYRGKRGG